MTELIVSGLDRVGTSHELTPEQRDSLRLLGMDKNPRQISMGGKLGIQFNIDHVHFRVFNDKLLIQITLPRLIRNSNLIPVTFEELPSIAKGISDWLEIDYLQGRFNYLELSLTYGSSVQSDILLRNLGSLTHFNGSTLDDGGRVYKNSRTPNDVSRALTFYNKLQKLLAEGKVALENANTDLAAFMGLTPIRVEYTLQKKEFHKPNALYVHNLLYKDQWNTMFEKFANQLESIRLEQGTSTSIDRLLPCKPGKVKEFLASIGMRKFGRVELEKLFNTWRANGDVDRYQLIGLKNLMDELDLLGLEEGNGNITDTAQFLQCCISHLRNR